ncbi:3-methyl-2-oxobutanoate hydroxymethyltransferase [Bordetella genomosp. 9]|uniref:3-methyl-2-oxobutanoate hydroxymethyltransferase n=1 Tax=Bordetella genomosp. 9 TaxID=1416803 RepID=A0A1W6Z4M2_9BORD|nr:3-methyl-2-oxobutanoate hydroxymethyltransferase [Bordetella genomosp. 9]ARP88317.1 3-methyl-2-oxobutanoate hydroxymethyltransferase [Bordetella genomosp. 9]
MYPTAADAAPQAPRKPITLASLAAMHQRGEKIAMLTCYDASFAALLDACGVDILLVGDSLGNVVQGQSSTLPVTLEQMVYHTECVARGNKTAWVLADLPWASYHESPAQAYASAARLLSAGAQMVKIEGMDGHTPWMSETVAFLAERGVPVCAHMGLTPQFVHALGGYRVQGKDEASAAHLKQQARTMRDAGASMLLYEMVPAALAAEITAEAGIPTIGIGAGPGCSGQVLVLHDMLNVFPGRKARFVRNFMEGAGSIQDAVRAYVQAVKDGSFPAAEHCY